MFFSYLVAAALSVLLVVLNTDTFFIYMALSRRRIKLLIPVFKNTSAILVPVDFSNLPGHRDDLCDR